MKRILLLIGALLFGLAVRSQSVTYTCRYWFDQNFAQATTTTFSASTWQAELDVGSLTEGLHALHLHVTDTSMKWSAPQTYLFLKTNVWENGTPNYVYHCWFDEDFANQQTDALGSGHLLLDVNDLDEGMHAVHVLVEGSTLTSTQSYLFMKEASFTTDSIDMSHLAYHCWFDQDFEHQQIDSLGNGHLLLDVNYLEDGLHTVHVMLQGSTYTSTQSYMFMKMAVEDPSAELQYICWFDQDYSTAQTGPLGSGLFELEVGDLPNGIHTVNVQLDNGTRTAPQCYLFYKQPLGGYNIARWAYWVNDDVDNWHTTDLNPKADTLDIISLLPVGHQSIRSSCFHFHPDGDTPYINAKNQITFRFWDSEMRFIDKSTYYIDEQVQQDIVATVFERNSTETFAAPRNNQITWFKLDVGVGDSLAFVADKACTMQLFAPLGEEVYSATASEAMTFGGCHAWEDGTYYLAVHDVSGSGETVSVTYQHLDKYVVLAYSPTEIGNTWGVFDVDVLGNGFDKLKNVILTDGSIEWQMDTIMDCHISQAAIRFAMNATTNNGNYDIVLCFEDYDGELDTLILSNAIQVVEAQFGTIYIDYHYQFSTTAPYMITVTVTNNGNVEYQGVPVLFAYSSEYNVKIGLYNDWITVQDDFFESGGKAIYHTDNLFNKGIVGDIIPLIIPKLGPHRTREIKLNVDAENGTDFDFYAWGGIPWSLKTTEAYDADSHYCQNHAGSLGWDGGYGGGNGSLGGENGGLTGGHAGGSGGDIGSVHVDHGENFGGVGYTVGVPNAVGGDTHGAASDAFSNSCDGLPDPCDMVGDIMNDMNECICGLIMGNGLTLGNMLNAMEGLNHRAQLEGVGITSQEEAEEYGLGGMWESAYNRKLQTPGSLLRGAIEHCKGLLPDAAQQLADTGLEGMKNDDCPQPPSPHPSIPRPSDPNDIRGYLSESGSHYMRQEIQNVQYEIEFENDTTLATAAAHTIIVRDTLDATKFDLNSLAARSVTIGDKRLELNGEQTFARTLDMRPELYVIAQIEQDYDPTTGIIQWTIQSLDPMTMEPTTNPYQGVLPVNYYGNGVGFIDYSVDIKEPFADGTAISNRAGIVFDQEEVIMTPTWTNIVDAVKPTSYIEEVTFEADTLNFSFVSSDNRSGVWYHSLYYRNESTDQDWKVKVPKILENSYSLHFDEYLTTEYLVMAIDSAGNMEEKDMTAEYVHYYDGPGPVTQVSTLSQGWNWWSTYVEMSSVDGLATFEESLGQNGSIIKSQDAFVQYGDQANSSGAWAGTLVAIDNESSYKVKVEAACTSVMSGAVAVPQSHPMTLTSGWNWIGYPVSTPQTVASALSDFEPASGDVIKGQGDFITYDESYGWIPASFVLNPGKGYQYYSNASANKTLVFTQSRGTVLPAASKKCHWQANRNAYPDNLSIMASVYVDGEELRDDNVELGAFVNGECRGSAKLNYVEPLGRHLAFLTVTGKDGDQVEFRLMDQSNAPAIMSVDYITFHSNAIIGNLGAPLPIRFGAMNGMTEMKTDMEVYPNPVDCNTPFTLMIPEGETAAEVLVVNALGDVVSHEAGQMTHSMMHGIPAAGLYMVKVTCKSGNVYLSRVVVK